MTTSRIKGLYRMPIGQRLTRAGAFNVHTLSGHIVVDGVAASHFSAETTWKSSKSCVTTWERC